MAYVIAIVLMFYNFSLMYIIYQSLMSIAKLHMEKQWVEDNYIY